MNPVVCALISQMSNKTVWSRRHPGVSQVETETAMYFPRLDTAFVIMKSITALSIMGTNSGAVTPIDFCDKWISKYVKSMLQCSMDTGLEDQSTRRKVFSSKKVESHGFKSVTFLLNDTASSYCVFTL